MLVFQVPDVVPNLKRLTGCNRNGSGGPANPEGECTQVVDQTLGRNAGLQARQLCRFGAELESRGKSREYVGSDSVEYRGNETNAETPTTNKCGDCAPVETVGDNWGEHHQSIATLVGECAG